MSKVKLLKVPEASVKKAIIQYLEILEKQDKIIWWGRMQCGMVKTQNGSYMHLGRPGSPDLVVCNENGGFVGLEVKGSHGFLTVEQKCVQEKINLRTIGKGYFVVKSVDDVQRIFR